MTDSQSPAGIATNSASNLKRKLLQALETETLKGDNPAPQGVVSVVASEPSEKTLELPSGNHLLENGETVYGLLVEEDEEPPLSEELRLASARLRLELKQVAGQEDGSRTGNKQKTDFDDTLSMRGVEPPAPREAHAAASVPSPLPQNKDVIAKLDTKSDQKSVTLESVISGGSMADLSGYKDLSKAPITFGDDDMPTSTLGSDTAFERAPSQFTAPQHFVQEMPTQEVDTEFSGNVKTLIRLVNELPEGVTKQTGAQIIRLTMEAMGISMEDVLSEAQSAQSEMLDAVRANIKKIEEYKTVIRKLETDIKYYQGKANELSEIIDLFILSNTSSQKMPGPDDLGHH